MLLTIIKYKLLQSINSLIRGPIRKRLEFLIILTLVPYLIVLTRSLSDVYMNVYKAIGWDGLHELTGMNMALVYLFMAISVTALSSYRLFHSNDIGLILSLPIDDMTLYSLKILESLGDTVRSMVLPLPVYIATCYVLIKIGAWAYVPFLCVGLLLIMIDISCVSIILAVIISRWIYIRKWAMISKLISVISLVAILIIFFKYLQFPEDTNVWKDFSGYNQSVFRPLIDLTSSSWLLRALEVNQKPLSSRLLYGFGFVIRTGALTALAYSVLSIGFKKILAKTMESPAYELSRRMAKRRVALKADRTKGLTYALLQNELRLILREPHSIIGLSVPLVMFPIFAIGQRYDQQTQTFYIALLSTLVNTSYTLHCIGREGRIFGMLRSLPMRLSSLLKAKFTTSFIINAIMFLLFLAFSSLFCENKVSHFAFNIIIGIVISLVLSSVGIGLSALFPKFDHTTPLRAVQMPGLFIFYLLSSLIIGTLMVGQMVMPRFFLLALIPWLLIGIIVLNVGMRRLERMDI